MNDAVAGTPASPNFQFSLGDIFFTFVTLAFPVALVASVEPDQLPDSGRTTIWVFTLITGVVAFLVGVSFRTAWQSRSPFFIPPFLLCVWSWVLLLGISEIPNWLLYPLFLYPILFIGIATGAFCRKIRAENPYFTGFFAMTVVALITYPLSRTVSDTRMATRETMAAATCKAIAEAQETYHRTDHDGDGVKEYSPNLRNLYETKPGAADLKLIPSALARADITTPSAQPYRGYYYRILLGQGDMAPGGAKSWIDSKGNLSLAHGAVAYPAEHGKTGLHSFTISSTGTMYQKDYGPDMPRIAKDMVFDPDTNWGCCE